MSDHAHDESGYSLVMPFVVVRSVGGPHDDQSFVAGYRLGVADQQLRQAAAINAHTYRIVAEPADVPQLDLIAMRHGYTMRVVPLRYELEDGSVDDDGWVTALFRRQPREVV